MEEDFDITSKPEFKSLGKFKISNSRMVQQNKDLIDKAEKLMLKHFGFTKDGGIIAKEQLKIFEIVEQLKEEQ